MRKINTAVERDTFDILRLHRLLPECRANVRRFATRSFFPTAPLDVQLFPALPHGDFGGSKRQLAGFRKGPFPGEIEVRDISGFIQPARHVQRCVQRLDNRLAQLEHLFIRLMQIKGGPHSRRKVEHGARDSKFRLLKAGGRHSLPQRHIKNIEKIHNRAEFQIRLAAGKWET